MEDSWSIFTDDLDEEPAATSSSFTPSSFNPTWTNPSPLFPPNPETPQERRVSYDFDSYQSQPFGNFTVPESAPSTNYQNPFASPKFPEDVRVNEETHQQVPETIMYATVNFKASRSEVFKFKSSLNLSSGDYVITEADRGYDIGKVSSVSKRGNHRTEQKILRRASEEEIRKIPAKRDKEKRAKEVCQQKATELGLPMTITDTEFQLDGKKLTVYFSAKQFIDFRDLVRVLFKTFETRIWMVWFDGNAPVKAVLEQQRKPLTITKQRYHFDE